MIVFHGTTDRRARRIAQEGFLPKKPSKRVWFAQGGGYALGRARTQARRAHARAIVLTCELNLAQFRERLGAKRVRCRNGIVAIDGAVPPSVLRSGGEPIDQPSSPAELAEWINRLLGLKPYKGVARSHPGLLRLSRWVVNRTQDRPRRPIRHAELLHMARQWLPEFLRGFQIDPEDLMVFRSVNVDEPEPAEPEPPADAREDEALALLDDPSPKRRIRGLALLAEIAGEDLFDFCAMYLDDDSPDVQLAALHTMLRCEEGEPEVLQPLADSPDKRIRGAAIAALAGLGEPDAPAWFERGLKDPSPCVRLETAGVLGKLDPVRHRSIFALALHDPNPKVAELAGKLTAGKGYPKVTYRPGSYRV